jgi:hypothetical protein
MLRRFSSSSVHVDFEPHSVIKVISRNGGASKQQPQKKKKVVTVEKKEVPNQNEKNAEKTTQNEMGIQMISKNLFQQIFKNATPINISSELIEK